MGNKDKVLGVGLMALALSPVQEGQRALRCEDAKRSSVQALAEVTNQCRFSLDEQSGVLKITVDSPTCNTLFTNLDKAEARVRQECRRFDD